MCGIVGIVSSSPVNQQVYDALLLLQHRGQDASGIATSDGRQIMVFKDMGLVSQVFNESALESLGGTHLAIGHTRYSTTGASTWKRQPSGMASTWSTICCGVCFSITCSQIGQCGTPARATCGSKSGARPRASWCWKRMMTGWAPTGSWSATGCAGCASAATAASW